MHTTPASLLERLRQPSEQAAWGRFVELYTPLLYYWARGVGLPYHEAADLVQDVLLVLVRKLPTFVYDPAQSFRGWLRTVTLNKWRETCRHRTEKPTDGAALAEVPAPDEVAAFEEAEYQRYLVGRALKMMQAEFAPATWKACWEYVVVGRPAAEVAAELGVGVDQVYGTKYRVLRRLRQELDRLLT